MSKNCRENLGFGKKLGSLEKCLYLWQFIIHLELRTLKVMKPRKWYWSIITFRANMKFTMSYWEYFTPGCSTPCSSKRGKGCKLCPAMSNTNSITNKLTKKSCLTSKGKCNTTDTIYAAKCTKHDLIYVGHSSQILSGRFNSHSSDVKVKPNACELSQHFHESKKF